MIQVKNSIKCKINTPQKINAKLNASIIYVEPDLEELEVMPSREEQHFVSEKDGYSNVTIKGDENLTPNNILKGVKIFDVTGELDAIDTSDATATPEDIRKDKTAYVDGEKITGTLEVPEQPTKGIIINEHDTNGYPIDVSIVGMTSIPEYFFNGYNSSCLTMKVINVRLPENLTKIGRDAFHNCSNLVLTELPEGITSIGGNAFYGCTKLALTELPEGLTNIDTYTFYNCTNLVLTKLPDSLTSIGTYAFQNCKNLALTKLPEGLKGIGSSAFYGCTNMPLTKLPDGLTTIGGAAFYSCSKLAITEIPSGVTSIGSSTFYSCNNFSSELTCYGDIKTIGASAFGYCSRLGKFVMPNITSVPTLSNTNAFTATSIASKKGYIYVPDNLVDSFKTATNWSTYANQIKGVSELV